MKQMAGRTAILALGVLWHSGQFSWAQAPGGGSTGLSRATQLPPTTGESGGNPVVAQQNSGSGNSTVTSSVQVGSAFSGSIPGEQIPAGPIQLTLAEAVKRGLATNLGPVVANDTARAARAQRLQALSDLLPNISASASNTVTQVNLAAYGFQFHIPASLGFSIPSVVGPYNYSSLQGSLSQSIYDPVARRNLQSAKALEHAANLSARDARELVVLAVGGTYLQALATAARVTSQKAEVDNARAIFNQAQVRKAAGTNARIDVTRSEVEFQTEQQRLSSLTADYRKQIIALARLIGLPQDREINLANALDSNPSPVPEAAQAIQFAFSHRADLDATAAQVHAAELALSAARAERLPAASINGNYGVIGPNPETTHGVFAVTASVTVPIWQGGRTGADIDQAEVTLHQRQAELADQRGRVEQGVRNALIELETAEGQVKVAERNRQLAADTLTQARDRFAAGVATTVEVVQAQQQVASADSDYISSVFSMNLSRLSLAREMGETETGLLTNKGGQ
jgi:outer membrane protein TolC